MTSNPQEDLFGEVILDELSDAKRFSAWMAEVIAPYFGERILEIGSGIGNISRQLPRTARITLSDCDPRYVELLRQQYADAADVEVRMVDLARDDDFGVLRAQYDCVICLNVLEHVQDDGAGLRRMRSALRPGGRLIVLVPQYPLLMSRMDRELGHFRRYRRRELTRKMAHAGLEIVTAFNFNALGLAGWLVNNRLLGRTTLGRSQLRIYDTLVPAMRRFERWFPHPGLSLVAVGRLPEVS